MFAGNPCYRWQNHGEFGMLFNTLLHWNDMPAAAAPAPATQATVGVTSFFIAFCTLWHPRGVRACKN
jgi:hypothetical protein